MGIVKEHQKNLLEISQGKSELLEKLKKYIEESISNEKNIKIFD
jgi:hypothetical protein